MSKTVVLGQYSNIEEYCKALQVAGVHIHMKTRSMLEKVEISKTRMEVDLVLPTVAEFGFPEGACLMDLENRRGELGLQLCPAEVGFALSLVYFDRRPGQHAYIKMEPLVAVYHVQAYDVAHGYDPSHSWEKPWEFLLDCGRNDYKDPNSALIVFELDAHDLDEYGGHGGYRVYYHPFDQVVYVRPRK